MTTQEILAKVASGELSADEASKLLPAGGGGQQTLTVKANPEKRTVSLYGLGRNPTTLYRAQWERLFSEGREVVEAFLKEHSEYLPQSKGQEAKAVPAALIGDGKPFRIPKGKAA